MISYFSGKNSNNQVSPIFEEFIITLLQETQQPNGRWYARDLQKVLNYSSYSPFASEKNKKSKLKAARLFVENSENHFKPCERDSDPDWELTAIACMAILKECRNRPSVIAAKQFFKDLLVNPDSTQEEVSLILLDDPHENDCVSPEKQKEILNTWGSDIFDKEIKHPDSANLVFSVPSQSEPADHASADGISPFDAIRHYDKNGAQFWTARDLMHVLDIDSFGFFEDGHDSLISNAIAQCQDCGLKADSEFRKKYLDWDLSYMACHFIFKRFNNLAFPKVREAQDYFGCFGEVDLNADNDPNLVTIYFEPPEVMPKHKQPGVVFTSKQKQQLYALPTKEINPFDAIRHNYPNGMEFWKARELMKLLKIRGFGMFKDNIPNSTISQAMAQYETESLECEKIDIKYHFCKKEKDWELSAFACYLIFIRVSRVTYPEVEKAQEYFAREVGRTINPDLKANLKIVPNDSSAIDTLLSSQKNQESGISPFDAIRRYDKDGNEYWSARELMEVLGYSYWETFGGQKKGQTSVIQKAVKSLKNSGYDPDANIRYASKVVNRQGRGFIEKEDWDLSRRACYVMAMNGDPNKEEIALAQAYFTDQARENELRKQREAEPKKKTASEAIAFATQCLIDAGIEKPVVNQYQLRQLAKIEPENAEYYENACAQLASGYILENKPILVTKVGQMICDRLGLNRNIISFAHTVNEKLIEIGFQEKDIVYKNNKPYNKGYVLTDAGKPWAIVENPTDSEGRVRPQIKWLPQIGSGMGRVILSDA